MFAIDMLELLIRGPNGRVLIGGILQFHDSEGQSVHRHNRPRVLADIANLDARRASVGLGAIAEYVKVLGEQTGLSGVWPPPRQAKSGWHFGE
jgi:hypothetical protein